MKHIKKIIGRILIVLPPVALQMAWYVLIISVADRWFNGHLWDIISAVFTVLSVVFILYLVNKREESTYKLLWVIIILTFPVFGAILFLTLGNKKTGKNLRKKLEESSRNLLKDNSQVDKALSQHEDAINKIRKSDLRISQTLDYVSHATGFPIHINGTSKYYPLGEDAFKDMIDDLEKAEKYVYIEYFIIQTGKFWNTLTDILERKASIGVDVRVIYDDLGSVATYSLKDVKHLNEKGIKCVAFNPFFFIRSQLNNRDHRKLMVIDGRVAYSGGINLADEYINEKEMFGHWKDIAFRITGPAVQSYTYMFAEFWEAFSKYKIPMELLEKSSYEKVMDDSNGYILPYYDSPMRNEAVSNALFTEMLSIATDYIWFYTPYLILGDTLTDAFVRAAERGVDVKIIMPGIPDKKIIYRIGRSYYEELLSAGVKIYEYTPGFIHAKAVVMDDKVAGIGTVNLDYRSLFLHFECYSIFYKADIVDELKKDYQTTLSKSRERTLNDTKRSRFGRVLDRVLRLAAPLL